MTQLCRESGLTPERDSELLLSLEQYPEFMMGKVCVCVCVCVCYVYMNVCETCSLIYIQTLTSGILVTIHKCICIILPIACASSTSIRGAPPRPHLPPISLYDYVQPCPLMATHL